MNHEIEAWGSKLDSMTADEIAAFCAEEGVQAIPLKSDRCAIAELVYKKTGKRVAVGHAGIYENVDRQQRYGPHIYLWGSPGPRNFIHQFDMGLHSHLDRNSDRG